MQLTYLSVREGAELTDGQAELIECKPRTYLDRERTGNYLRYRRPL